MIWYIISFYEIIIYTPAKSLKRGDKLAIPKAENLVEMDNRCIQKVHTGITTKIRAWYIAQAPAFADGDYRLRLTLDFADWW